MARRQRYFTLLAGSLQPDHNPFGLLDVNLSSLLTAEAGPFLDFLRSERYRAEAAVSYIRVKPVDDLFKQEMLRMLDIEARFYSDLIDYVATPRHPRWQPDSEWVPLLFISLPRTLR